jgi:hypothetical protein
MTVSASVENGFITWARIAGEADPDPDPTRKLIRFAKSVEAGQDGRIRIEQIASPFWRKVAARPGSEFGAGIGYGPARLALLRDSGTYNPASDIRLCPPGKLTTRNVFGGVRLDGERPNKKNLAVYFTRKPSSCFACAKESQGAAFSNQAPPKLVRTLTFSLRSNNPLFIEEGPDRSIAVHRSRRAISAQKHRYFALSARASEAPGLSQRAA